MQFYYALILTLIVETPFYFFFSKRNFKDLFIFLALNIITNVAFNLLYVFLYEYSEAFLIVGEVLVFITETVFFSFYKRELTVVSLLVPAFANGSSLGIGLLIENYLFPISSIKSLSVYLTIFFVLELLALIGFITYRNIKK